MTTQHLFSWLPGCHGNPKCLQNRPKYQIIAIHVTIGTTHINITLSFVLHMGRDISAYEMNTKFENIL